ncbi:MAG: glycosyltransferase family 39 protein [Rhodobacteraceae bacterium]|nr:glycosyltransferase family 39 protein [Paracoccaceae bacterium]MCP5342230.1 glycosyltransferase family 39 protein [Paracoccaceae bacterium]
MPERQGWFLPASALVGAVTLARLAALWFDRTDLFVDESQYWLWGQRLDFGYFSKPPLIAWVIRGVTELAGSDAAFWVRLPGAILHGVTALILAALAAYLFDRRAAIWVAISYATLPMAALGSLLMSTDTVMAPLFAAALCFHFRLAHTGQARFAGLAGAAIGLAFLAKYAAIYFFVGAAVAAIWLPGMRISWRNAALMGVVFLLCIAPNIWWNLSNNLITLHHTGDNIDWADDLSDLLDLEYDEGATFFLSQFAVFGPVLFAALLWGYWRPSTPDMRALTLFSMPVLAIVCLEALLSRAYANWAVAAYFSGTLVAVPLLVRHAPALLRLSLVINAAIAILLPLLTIIAPAPAWNGKPLLARYLGRADLSRQIIAAAQATGAKGVVAAERGILADLFHTGAGSGLRFYAPRPRGRPQNYYEQNFALPESADDLLAVLPAAPVCQGTIQPTVAGFSTDGGAYQGHGYSAYLLSRECLNVLW